MTTQSEVRQRLMAGRRAVVWHGTAAKRADFDAHEQAPTEILLTRVAPAVKFVTFTQVQEATAGSDWLWWWHSGDSWFGMLVQAKRNTAKSGMPRYDFGYRSGRGKSRLVELVIGSVQSLKVPAVYVRHSSRAPGATAG
jgi:hypothetical protein